MVLENCICSEFGLPDMVRDSSVTQANLGCTEEIVKVQEEVAELRKRFNERF